MIGVHIYLEDKHEIFLAPGAYLPGTIMHQKRTCQGRRKTSNPAANLPPFPVPFTPLLLNSGFRKQKPGLPSCRQVRLLKSLDHCNIIRFIDFFLEKVSEKDRRLVIVFEW